MPRDGVRTIVRAILERKYADIWPPAHVEAVVHLFRDDPVQICEPRYSPTPIRWPTNSAAVASHILSRHGRVAILDAVFHHGNGQ